MAKNKKSDIKKLVAIDYFNYSYYRKERLDKFKTKLCREDWYDLLAYCNAGFIFDEWLVDNKIVRISSFEKWRKSQI